MAGLPTTTSLADVRNGGVEPAFVPALAPEVLIAVVGVERAGIPLPDLGLAT